jgi:3-deoxy-manno-octulosonate cytidylyltransferase (CMP-KDO synthetase)
VGVTGGPTAVVVVPARMASVRFPGKVLASATGMPLVQHVVLAARRAACAARVVVATDDRRVEAALKPLGTEVVMTSAEHANGTNRLAEAAQVLGLADDQIVVNAQGDEPELEPAVVDAAVGALVRTGAPMATAAARFGPGEDARNPNVVKVVVGLDGAAMYFSRAVIPFDRDGRGGTGSTPLKHIGVYAYRRSFLERYAALAATPLERVEQLEQLRALESGHRIAVAVVGAEQARGQGIDTREQYEEFVKRWRARGR